MVLLIQKNSVLVSKYLSKTLSLPNHQISVGWRKLGYSVSIFTPKNHRMDEGCKSQWSFTVDTTCSTTHDRFKFFSHVTDGE